MAAREQSQVQEVLGLLRRRALQIFLPAVVTGAIGWALAELWPRTYYAETKLEVRDVTPPVASQGIDAKVIQRDIDNAKWQVKQFERIVRVLEKLEWREYKELTDPVERTEYVKELIDRIGIVSSAPANKVVQGSILLTISYKDNDPKRAEQFLNRLREVFVSEVLDRYRNDARRTADLLRNQLSLTEGKAKDADAAAAKLKKDAGVSATQQAPGGGRQRDEDPIFKRLDTAQAKLFDAEASVAASVATLEQLKKLLDETPAEVPQSQTLGGLSFDDELAAIETAKVEQRERQQGLLPAHKTYQDAEYKLRKLDAKLEQLLAVARAPETDTRMAPNPVRAALQDRIRNVEIALSEAKALKARMESEVQTLRVESAARVEIYRQLQDLDRQAAVASDSYLRAAQAYGKQMDFVEFIGSPFANPFEITEIARAPKRPISPNGALFIGGGLIFGLILGLGSSLIDEFGRNGVRSAAEAVRIAGAPVLGVVNRIRTRREKRERSARSIVVVVSTLAIAASVLWTTWAYKHEPQALGVSLRSALDRFRESLR
jgi:succinoglycan biosynthesis transport protein ExoP